MGLTSISYLNTIVEDSTQSKKLNFRTYSIVGDLTMFFHVDLQLYTDLLLCERNGERSDSRRESLALSEEKGIV